VLSEVISSTCWQFHFEATGKFTGFLWQLSTPVPKRVRAQQIPYFFRSPYTTTALSDLHYPFNNQNAGYPKLYQNSKNSHELSSSIFLRVSIPSSPWVGCTSSPSHPLQAFARDQTEHFRIGFKQPPQTEARGAIRSLATDSTCDVMKNCHTHTLMITLCTYIFNYIYTYINISSSSYSIPYMILCNHKFIYTVYYNMIPYIIWVWVKIRYPNNWMVNTKLD